jgi:hypothetical protein
MRRIDMKLDWTELNWNDNKEPTEWFTELNGWDIEVFYDSYYDRWFLHINDATEDGWEQDYKEKPTTQDVMVAIDKVIEKAYQQYLFVKKHFEDAKTLLDED